MDLDDFSLKQSVVQSAFCELLDFPVYPHKGVRLAPVAGILYWRNVFHFNFILLAQVLDVSELYISLQVPYEQVNVILFQRRLIELHQSTKVERRLCACVLQLFWVSEIELIALGALYKVRVK